MHTTTATKDDTTGTPDDEDGVTFATVRVGALGATATVFVSNAPSGAKLDAWIDFNRDGNWGGAQEQIANNVAVVNGSNSITFDVPSDALDGTTFARFRLRTTGNLGPEGAAADGEVEDYAVAIVPPQSGGEFGSQITIYARGNSKAASWFYGVEAADLDSDGDTDVLTASFSDDKITWYENNGNQSFTARVISAAADGAISVTVADLDRDGDLDVLSASFYDNKIAWYENNGSQTFTARTITISAMGAACVLAADVDGDGDLDVLSASSSDDKIAWYENNGSQSFTAHTISTSADGAVDVFAADLDRDGDLDVLSASPTDDKIAWYENNGSQSFTAHTISLTGDFAYSVHAADLDDDGDLDVLAASSNDHTVAWYENDGSQNFSERIVSSTGGLTGTVISVSPADFDGDGDLDLLAARAYNNTAVWFENDGHRNFIDHTISTSLLGAFAHYPADMDRDGDIDLLLVSKNSDAVAWYKNQPDTFAPNLYISPFDGTATNVSPVTFTFMFDDVVSGFTASDITLTNGTAGTFTVVNGGTYTLQVTPASAAPITVSVAANAASDGAGNGSKGASSTITIDTTRPALSITPDGNVTGDDPILFTFQFSETMANGSPNSVYSFSQSDITITNGTAVNFRSIDLDTYTLAVSPTSNGPVTVSVAADVAQDVAGNGNEAATASVNSDRTQPVLTITPGAATLSESPITFTFQFDEMVTGFTPSDISLKNGLAEAFTAIDGDTYTLQVTPISDGAVSVNVPSDAAQDEAFNGSVSASATVISERSAPTLSITPNATSTNDYVAKFTFEFTEPVTGFALSDITLSSNVSVINFRSLDSDTYFLMASLRDGVASVNVAANAVQDAAGKGNEAASASVICDQIRPTLTITPPLNSNTSSDQMTLTFQFSEPVTGFTASNIQLTSGTAETFTAEDADTYTLLVTDIPEGWLTVSVTGGAQDAALNYAGVAQNTYFIDRTAPTVYITPNNTTTNENSVLFEFSFSETVQDFTLSDIQMKNCWGDYFITVNQGLTSISHA